jgi:hypothetical protein
VAEASLSECVPVTGGFSASGAVLWLGPRTRKWPIRDCRIVVRPPVRFGKHSVGNIDLSYPFFRLGMGLRPSWKPIRVIDLHQIAVRALDSFRAGDSWYPQHLVMCSHEPEVLEGDCNSAGGGRLLLSLERFYCKPGRSAIVFDTGTKYSVSMNLWSLFASKAATAARFGCIGRAQAGLNFLPQPRSFTSPGASFGRHWSRQTLLRR